MYSAQDFIVMSFASGQIDYEVQKSLNSINLIWSLYFDGLKWVLL